MGGTTKRMGITFSMILNVEIRPAISSFKKGESQMNTIEKTPCIFGMIIFISWI